MRQVLALPPEWNGDHRFERADLEGHTLTGVFGSVDSVTRPDVTTATGDQLDERHYPGGAVQVLLPKGEAAKIRIVDLYSLERS